MNNTEKQGLNGTNIPNSDTSAHETRTKALKLVEIRKKQAITSSLLVAKKFGKEHKNVLRLIDEIIAETVGSKLSNAIKSMFVEDFYVNSEDIGINKNRKYRMYYMTRDGFSLLVMGFTGKRALQFKLDFISAFNKMEATLKRQKGLQVYNKRDLLTYASKHSRIENTQLLGENEKLNEERWKLIGEIERLQRRARDEFDEKHMKYLEDINYWSKKTIALSETVADTNKKLIKLIDFVRSNANKTIEILADCVTGKVEVSSHVRENKTLCMGQDNEGAVSDTVHFSIGHVD